MNILDQIKDCEREAAQLRAESAATARDCVRVGEREAEELAKKTINAAKNAAELTLEKARAASEAKAAEFIAQGAQNDEKLVAAAAAGLEKAVCFICEEVRGL
ncbi:MAG: hypothetical protein RR998_06575 [Oscillospiraceae bacterium]